MKTDDKQGSVFFASVKLPATCWVPVCRRCGALVSPNDGSGGTGEAQHRKWHASVDSGATVLLPRDEP